LLWPWKEQLGDPGHHLAPIDGYFTSRSHEKLIMMFQWVLLGLILEKWCLFKIQMQKCHGHGHGW
jgi:hypothetical protein